VGEDLRPSVFAEDEEHQHVEKAQKVDVDSGDAVVVRVSLENVFRAEGHGGFLVVMLAGGYLRAVS
jgi:hypothetical protein